jgi:hypothetical protein
MEKHSIFPSIVLGNFGKNIESLHKLDELIKSNEFFGPYENDEGY